MMEEYKGKFASSENPLIVKCDQLLAHLIKSNINAFTDDGEVELQWSSFVIDEDNFILETIEADHFVFISKSLIELCDNEHQLAYVLAHSLAHHILKHKVEPVYKYLHWKTFS